MAEAIPTGPDPVENAEYYDGVMTKRIVAYVIDFLICGALAFGGTIIAAVIGVMSFGLLFGPLMAVLALIPLIYHTWLIGSPKSATYGMQFCGIRVYKLDGKRPEIFQAFVQTAIFFLTVPVTSGLILVACLFNSRHRCLHDILAGTLVLNNVDGK